MSPIERAFLDDIIANPADDTPRLIYADWCEDNGKPERAKFIRVSVQLHMPMNYPPWYETPWDSQHRIVPGLPDKIMPKDGSMFVWSRGFVHAVRCPLDAWMAHGPALCREHPIEVVNVTDKDPCIWGGGRRGWWREQFDGDDPGDVPAAVFDLLDGGRQEWAAERKTFDSEAALAWAKAGACVTTNCRGDRAGGRSP